METEEILNSLESKLDSIKDMINEYKELKNAQNSNLNIKDIENQNYDPGVIKEVLDAISNYYPKEHEDSIKEFIQNNSDTIIEMICDIDYEILERCGYFHESDIETVWNNLSYSEKRDMVVDFISESL